MAESKIPCSIAIQVLPQVSKEQVFPIVDKVIAHIAQTGLTYVVSPFETTVEGDFDTLMTLIKECQLICIAAGAPQLLTYVKIAYAPEVGTWSIASKIDKHQGG